MSSKVIVTFRSLQYFFGDIVCLGFYELKIKFCEESGLLDVEVKFIDYEKPNNVKCIGDGGHKRFRMYERVDSPSSSKLDWHLGIGKRID